MGPTESTIRIVFIGLLIGVSAFLSGSETSIFSLSTATIRRLEQGRSRAGRLVALLRANPRALLITILLGNVAVNVLAAATMSETLRGYAEGGAETAIGRFLREGAVTLSLTHEQFTGLVSLFVMTLLILLIGEVTPKTLAVSLGERMALRIAPILYVWHVVITPARAVFLWVTDRLLALTGSQRHDGLSPDEVRTAIQLGHIEGELDQVERDMLHGVLEVRTKPVDLLMCPRNEMVTGDIEQPPRELAAQMRRHGVSRMPLWESEEENLVGVLHIRDYLINRNRLRTAEDMKSILMKPLFVPESKPAGELLSEFRRGGSHLAIVVDEYGGISGLVTLEDILEQIVGEIWDRADMFGQFRPLGRDKARVSGRLALSEFNRRFGTDLSAEGVATIAGFLIHYLRRIPDPGEKWDHGDLLFEVVSSDPNRIREIIVSRKPEEEGASQ